MAGTSKVSKEIKAVKVGEFSVSNIHTIKVRCEFIDDILGACPCDKEIYTKYIADKWKKAEKKFYEDHPDLIKTKIEQEVDALPEITPDLEAPEQKITVFLRDEEGNCALDQHVIKGFFKNAAKAFYAINKPLSGYKTKIDNGIFISPDLITIHTDEETDILQRPLRAETAQGPRVALAASEMINKGAWIEFEIMVMNPELLPHVYDWLEYGKLNGLGQWHNGGKGRFNYKEITE